MRVPYGGLAWDRDPTRWYDAFWGGASKPRGIRSHGPGVSRRGMFWGSHDHVLDEKGRTSIPKEFRALLAGKNDPWITAFPDCLAIYPAEAFEGLLRRLTETSDSIDSLQQVQRLIVGMAVPCRVDRQGRMLVPPKLREWAFLEREIVFTGVMDHVEIWDRARHRTQLEQVRGNFGRLMAHTKE